MLSFNGLKVFKTSNNHTKVVVNMMALTLAVLTVAAGDWTSGPALASVSESLATLNNIKQSQILHRREVRHIALILLQSIVQLETIARLYNCHLLLLLLLVY